MTLSQLLLKIQVNKSVDFGEIFNEAINLFQKVWLQGLLLQLLVILVSYGVSMVMYIPMMASVFVLSDLEPDEQGVVSIIIGILFFALYLIIIVLLATFSFGLQAAFFRIVRMKERNIATQRGVNFGMFFKKKHLKKLFVLAMAQIGISILAVMLCVIPIFYVIVPLQFASIIFAFHPELSVNDIYKAAFQIGNKKWGVAFALLLVSGILAIVIGFLACFIGIYATLSFAYLPAYLIYKEVVGFYEDEDAIAKIGV